MLLKIEWNLNLNGLVWIGSMLYANKLVEEKGYWLIYERTNVIYFVSETKKIMKCLLKMGWFELFC